ncbi:MAG: GNAT family N-acetyltransferase [Asgard group archaeon]|nr:GNAT family N-acetyltransferase [Asgard group archaeon]
MDIELIECSLDNIELIKPIWKKLRMYHEEKSINFKRDFIELTFEKRIEKIKEKAKKSGEVKILIARDRSKEHNVGYCIGSITSDNIGEVDSLFVLKKYRNFRVGDKLLREIINWLEDNKVDEIYIGVASGNEEVFGFYENYGFYPVVTKLKRPR